MGFTNASVTCEPIFDMGLLGCLSFHARIVSELEVTGLLILVVYLEVNFSFRVSELHVSFQAWQYLKVISLYDEFRAEFFDVQDF